MFRRLYWRDVHAGILRSRPASCGGVRVAAAFGEPVPDCGQHAIPDTLEGGAYIAHLLIRATLRRRGKFAGSQIMFFAGSDGIRLAGLEHRISRVGVGLGDQVRDGQAQTWGSPY